MCIGSGIGSLDDVYDTSLIFNNGVRYLLVDHYETWVDWLIMIWVVWTTVGGIS